MLLDPKSAERIARRFFNSSAPLKTLGWGISGFVFLSPDLRTAAKVHRASDGFERELTVYERLKELGIFQLVGLTIPKLIASDASVKLLQMDFVSAPYLLDFAGVRLSPPDFSDETMTQWHEDIAERFAPNVGIVSLVYDALARHGLYYMDFRQSNLNLTGLAGTEVRGRTDEE